MTEDPSLSRRHLELQERFRAQQEARAQSRQDAKTLGEEYRDPKECVGLFWSDLRKSCEGIVEALHRLREEAPQQQNNSKGHGDGDSVTSQGLTRLGTQIHALEKKITDAALYLPPYDVRRAQEEVGILQAKLDTTRTALAPRKKFSFASRRKGTEASSSSNGAGESSQQQQQQQQQTSAFLPIPAPGQYHIKAAAAALIAHSSSASSSLSSAAITAAAKRKEQQQPPEMEGFANQRDCTLTLRSLIREKGGEREGKYPTDLLLSDLTHCTIYLFKPMSFLRLENVKDCQVYCGPVAGPVYLESCQGSTIFLVSRQLRIHNTMDCDLYVHTVSGPIIEDCDGLRFAPFTLFYPDLATHMKEAQLAGSINAWEEVKDFKWLKAHQSPHWSIVPEGERTLSQKVRDDEVEGGREAEEGGGRDQQQQEEEDDDNEI